ncbi:MAG: thiamine pyrophosphate-dependent enzyme [Nanoarchaeota archaeon]
MNLENIAGTSKSLMEFEDELAALWSRGEINGPVHFAKGNEEQIIKIFRGLREGEYIKQLPPLTRQEVLDAKLVVVPEDNQDADYLKGIKKEDFIFVSYRNHAHILLKGMPQERVRQDIIEGRSMYPMDKEYGVFSSAIVPGHLKPAVGLAMAYKLSGSKGHVWAFCGDMAAQTGAFHEATNYASNHELPIIFVIEDNGMSVDTPTREVWGMDKNRIPQLLPNTIYYAYKNSFKHQGAGKEAGF